MWASVHVILKILANSRVKVLENVVLFVIKCKFETLSNMMIL